MNACTKQQLTADLGLFFSYRSGHSTGKRLCQLCPRLAHCLTKSRCARYEWPLFTPHCRAQDDTHEAKSVLRARAAKIEHFRCGLSRRLRRADHEWLVRATGSFAARHTNPIDAGQTRLLLTPPLLTQKMFALAAVNFRRCSGFHESGHSSLAIPQEFKAPFRCTRILQSRRGHSRPT